MNDEELNLAMDRDAAMGRAAFTILLTREQAHSTATNATIAFAARHRLDILMEDLEKRFSDDEIALIVMEADRIEEEEPPPIPTPPENWVG